MKNKISLSLFLIFFILFLGSCTTPNNEGKKNPNQFPATILANVPPADSVYTFNNAVITLYWSGKDPDGFVTGFRFRWITYQPNLTTTTTPWRTILNTSFVGNINKSLVVEVKEPAHSIQNAFHYLTTLTDEDADRIIGKLDSGFIVVYQGDSLFRANVKEFQNPNKGTFIFDSRADSNVHQFEIKAVDNEGAQDVSPATTKFGTPKIFPPDTRLTLNASTTLTRTFIDSTVSPPATFTRRYDRIIHPMLPTFTSTYEGLTFTFFGADSASPDLEFQWKVDNQEWSSFSPATEATVNASNFDSSNNGWFDTSKVHFFTVRARNQYLLVDLSPDTVFLKMKVPEFIFGAPRYLILDNTDSLGNQQDSVFVRESPTPNQRMKYFRETLDSINLNGVVDTFRVGPKNTFPNSFILSKYKAIILIDEKKVRGTVAELSKKLLIKENNVKDIIEYLNLGGKLIVSGWDFYSRVYNDANNQKNRFFNSSLRLNTQSLSMVRSRDFSGAIGRASLGYPDVSLDTTKLLGNSGAMDSIAISPQLGILAEVIYYYNSKSNNPSYQGKPIGLQYLGPTYKVVYFGFPLYYIPQHEAKEVLRRAFINIGEINN